MAQAVSRRPVTTQVRVRSCASVCEVCDGQDSNGQVFSEQCSILIFFLIKVK